jgi:CRP/FNR family transcriptional regulator, cyclic AMP receptor protein
MLKTERCIFQQLLPNDTELVKAPRGKLIFMPEQNASFIYHLHEGVIGAIRTTGEGHEITDLYVPPQLIGLIGLVDMYKDLTKTYLAEARAVTSVIYCKTRREAVWEMLDDRGARAEIFNMLVDHIIFTSRLTASPLRNDVANRVLYVLQILTRSIAKRGEDSVAAIKDITHDDIALIANTTRATVTRILSKLEKGGLITIGRRQIMVLDRKSLYRLSSLSALEPSN